MKLPSRNSIVQLTTDLTTKGGVAFKKGLKMRVYSTDGLVALGVWVRGRWRSIHLKKIDCSNMWTRPFVVIEEGKPEEEED